LLEFLIPLHAVLLEGLHSLPVVGKDLGHMNPGIHIFRGSHLTQLLCCAS
jgi:hypothetical protein